MIIETQEELNNLVERLEDEIEVEEEEDGIESSIKVMLEATDNFNILVEPALDIYPSPPSSDGDLLEEYATFRWNLINGEPPENYRTIGPLIEAIEYAAATTSELEILLIDFEDPDSDDLEFLDDSIGGNAYVLSTEVSEERVYFQEKNQVISEEATASDSYYSSIGIWNSRQFDGESFDLNSVIAAGFKVPVRPLKYSKNDIPKKEGTLYVVGLNGVVWFGTSNFILESVQKIEQEMPIIISSMAGNSINFACSPNSTYRFLGRLFDASNYDWARNWEYNWQAYMRGKVTARNNCRIVLLYNQQMITGYMVNFQTTSQVGSQLIESVMFDLFVSNYEIIPPVINTSGEEYIAETLTLGELTER